MTAKANPLAVDQGATEKELTGSESNSQDQSTPGGISSASDNNVDAGAASAAPAGATTASAPAKGQSTAKSKKEPEKKVLRVGNLEVLEDMVRQAALDALQIDELDDDPSSPAELRKTILNFATTAIRGENVGRARNEMLTPPKALDARTVATILMRRHRFVLITPDGGSSDADLDLLAVYQTSGPDEGTYVSGDDTLRRMARQYNTTMKASECDEVFSMVRDECERIEVCLDRDLIPLNNGIFHYQTKELMPFSPDLVFTSKSAINWNPNAQNVVITMPDGLQWDVVSWMDDLFPTDPERTRFSWQVAGAALRPNVRWGKAIFPYSEVGNNGKGTFAQMVRNLLGRNACAGISMDTFGREFGLEGLIGKQACIVDENVVGAYLEFGANFKAAVTWDILDINRKMKRRISYRFRGLIIECLNSFPRSRDKSDSWYRRQIFLPFDQQFEGVERKYIKDDYLARHDVLEFVLKRVLLDMPNYYELEAPAACLAVMDQYKEENDPVRAFCNATLAKDSDGQDMWGDWQMVPLTAGFDHFLGWAADNNVSSKGYTKSRFTKEFHDHVMATGEWVDMTDRKAKALPTALVMPGVPPITIEHRTHLAKWVLPVAAIRPDVPMVQAPTLPKEHRGYVRQSFVDLKNQTGSWEKAAAAREAAKLVTKDAAAEADPFQQLGQSPFLPKIEEQARQGVAEALSDVS